jgi:hypothetical protein
MTRTSRDRKIIFVLLIALALQILLLLAHTGVIPLHRTSSREGVQAGRVSEAHNQLRRRGLNSLVWENSQTAETVYFHDSILTLKGSTAKLDLQSTQVVLSENTLITIEPPDEHQAGEIRLRFLRGNLEARNPFQNSKIQGESWSVDVKQGSQVELREVGQGNVEVVLKDGAGTVQSPDGAATLKANEIVRLKNGVADHLKLDTALAWLNVPPKRTYLHGDIFPTSLEWQGDADSVVIQTLGLPERSISIASGTHRYLADLGFGNHRLYLRKGDSSSVALDIQVWRAPLIHLLAPLPRNRVELGENVNFLWQKSPEVNGFRFRLEGPQTKLGADRELNEFSTTFSTEDDAKWFVEGVDREGFTVPPLYRYPLFIREKPLPAPKLRTPELRAPAQAPPGPGAWLWSQILPQAHADEQRLQAVFSWEPVTGADQYVIEISESADFRNPIVNTTIRKSEFIWDRFPLSEYHWRVAAGHSRGRMGVFTEPARVDFSPLKKNPNLVVLNGIEIRKVETPAPEPVAPPPPPEPITKAEPEPQPEPKPSPVHLSEAQKKWQFIGLWQPRFGMIHAKGTESSEANLNGATIPSLGLELPWRGADGGVWLFDSSITSYVFKPVPKAKFPFQEDLKWIEFDVSLLRFRSPFGYGFSARQNLSLRRTGYEAITADTALGFGPVVQWNIAVPRGDFNVRSGVFFNSNGQVLTVAPEWRGRIGPRFVTGFGVEAQCLINGSDLGYSAQGFATIGFPF